MWWCECHVTNHSSRVDMDCWIAYKSRMLRRLLATECFTADNNRRRSKRLIVSLTYPPANIGDYARACVCRLRSLARTKYASNVSLCNCRTSICVGPIVIQPFDVDLACDRPLPWWNTPFRSSWSYICGLFHGHIDEVVCCSARNVHGGCSCELFSMKTIPYSVVSKHLCLLVTPILRHSIVCTGTFYIVSLVIKLLQ